MIPNALLNGWAASWAAFMVRALIESTVVLALVGLPWLALRRRLSAQLSYGLFLLVLLKLALPVSLTAPAWLARLSPRHSADRLAGWAMSRPASVPSEPWSDPFAPAPLPPELASGPTAPRTTQRAPVDHHERTSFAPSDATTVNAPAPRQNAGTADRKASTVSRPGLSAAAALMLAWAAVVLALLARLVWVHVRMHRQLRGAVLLDPDQLPVDLADLRRLAGLRRAVPVLETSAVAAPAVWGWTRPRLLLPPGLVAELSPAQLSWVVLHELVHIVRGDIWVATLQRLVQTVYFFHPTAWLANHLIDVQREYACDDAALALGGLSRRDCGAGLLTVVGRAHGLPAPAAPALGLFRSEASIRRRLLRLLDTRRRLHGRLSLGAAALLVALALIVLPNLRAQDGGRESGKDVPAKAAPAPKEDARAGADQKATDRAIVGEVVDAEGKPAAGADVWLVGMTVRENKSVVLGQTRTDENGRFRLPPPDATSDVRSAGLWAYRPGALTAWTARDPDGPTSLEKRANRLTLGAPVHARIRILDPDGAPVPGAQVAAYYVNAAATSVPEELIKLTSAETDAEGRATLPAFAPTEIQGILVTSARFGRQTAMFRGGVVGEAPIRLRPVARVSGRVTADDAESVRRLTVSVESSRKNPNNPDIHARAETSTDDSGRFEIPAVAAGNLMISVSTRPSSPYVAPRFNRASVEPGELARVEIRLLKAVRVRGEVRDKLSGQPLVGAKLRYSGAEPVDSPPVETDANGRYEALAVPGEGYYWVAPPKGYLAPYPRASTPVTIGSEPEQSLPPIELERGASLRGVVVGEDGKPVSGANVEGKWEVVEPVSRPGGGSAIGHNFNASATSDDRGTFLLEGIHPEAQVTLEAHAAEARTEKPQTASPGNAEPVTLRISGANTVAMTGRVVDSSGAPIAGALVQLQARPPGPDGSTAVEPVRFSEGSTIRTDRHGRFRTPRQLRRGYAYRAEARVEGFMNDVTSWLSLRPDTVPTLPDLPLRRVRTVSGRVLDTSGRAVAGATVRQSGDGPVPTRAVTDSQGRFTVPGVVEGRVFLFVDRPGYRSSWKLVGPEGANIDLAIARDDEPGPEPLTTQPSVLTRAHELALLHRLFDPYAEQVFERGGPTDRRWVLSILMRIDPARALDVINADGDARSRDYERRQAALQLVPGAADEAALVIESIEDPDARALAEVMLAAALPATERAHKLDLLAQAQVNARGVTDPAKRALKFAKIGEGLLDLGDTERATKVLREGQVLAKELPKVGWAGYARRTVAEELAPVDLPGALELIQGMEADREHDATLGRIAHELAARSPAEAERVLGMMRDVWPNFRDNYAQRVCYRMASVDPDRARALAGRMKDHRPKARALGVIALALKADRPAATRLVREAFAVLERAVDERENIDWNGLATASTAAAGLLPIAEQVDPRLVPEALGRTLALRPPLRGADSRDGIAALSDAQVAGAVAQYDHEAARAVLDACSRDLLTLLLGATERNHDFYVGLLFDAATVVDPQHALALLDRLPEPADLAISRPRNSARLHIARTLTDSGEKRWRSIELRLLHLWQVDSEE